MSLLAGWLWIGIASAAVPDTARLAVLSAASDDLAQGIVCRPVAGVVRLCVRWAEEGTWRWCTPADLVRWQVDVDELFQTLTTRSSTTWFQDGAWVDAAGLDARTWQDASGDGWEGAVLLHGGALEALVGRPVRLGLPTAGAVVAWRGDEGPLDMAVTVGIAEAFAAADAPVTDAVLTWRDGAWIRWGRATAPTTADPTQRAAPENRRGASGADGDRTHDL